MTERQRQKQVRDRHGDREAGKERDDPEHPPPSGKLGPAGEVLEKFQGEGGAMEPDPPDDKG